MKQLESKQLKNQLNHQQPVADILMVRLKEGGFILLIAVAAFLLISLWSFSPDDPGWTVANNAQEIQNASQPC